jgi:cytochrome oxidase Cu insertion factor (SCO1/SenC/PrrC family)
MKNILASLLLPIFILLFLSFDNESMLNHPIPLLPNKTLDGKIIDENYYKGHVSIVSFMYIGCFPCMNEISTLNKIKEDYGSNEQL